MYKTLSVIGLFLVLIIFSYWISNINANQAAIKPVKSIAASFLGAKNISASLLATAATSEKSPTQNDISFIYSFKIPGTLNEAGNIGETTSPYWWVNSGGELIIGNNVGSTIIGNLSSNNKWYRNYAESNPLDTDGGEHPQNIFRLVTVGEWNNFTQEGNFKILADHFSSSPNRNSSNGLLFFNRYALGGQTLYYAGIRVDGTAVIKKKYQGTYYTMAQKQIFPGTYNGDQDNVNLIPHNVWIGLRSDTHTNSNGSVTVTLYMQNAGQTTWTQLLTSTDSGQYGATPPIIGLGHAGIRTDFMDVEFSNYSMTPTS